MNHLSDPLSRRRLLHWSGAGALALASRAPAQSERVFRPEDFGARGDGRSNDTLAFAAMSRAVEANGGGLIRLSARTYLVGLQGPGPRGAEVIGSPIIQLRSLRGALRIEGNGAVLRAVGGLRFGAFEPRDLRPARRAMPNLDLATRHAPYLAMVFIDGCSGPVSITGLELDGRIGEQVLGGEWGDTGRQVPMSGLFLRNNRGGERLSDIHAHHQGLDGLCIDGHSARIAADRLIERVHCDNNGRQGCSVVGGQDYRFADCDFSQTGRAGVTSAPGAGLDIEAEGGKAISGLRFTNCRFADNLGCGVVADSGPSRDVVFDQCQIIGTTAWAAWSAKPGFAYNRCTFIGASVRPYGSANPAEATQFNDCKFSDDPRLSPTGKVYLPDPTSGGPILDAGGAEGGGRNVVLRRCSVELSGKGLLPWTVATIYQDCTMRQASPRASFPRGIYRGTNRITGNAVLDGSRFEGPTTLNGRRLA